MVGMIKRILTQSLKELSPRVETLRSFLIEACNIINSRPLTHVPTTSLEEDPLTPNDFLLGEANRVQGFHKITNTEDKVWTLKKQWKIANHLKNHFWKRFVSEYIPTLNKRSRNNEKIGDLVLIADDNLVKNVWPRGVILETFQGRDGIIRSALIRTRDKTLKRPTCKLAVIGNSHTEPKKYTVFIEGNIGSGKSTLLGLLSKMNDVEVFPEPLQKWTNWNGENILQLFYNEPNNYAFKFQNHVFNTMLENHLEVSGRSIKIMERSLLSAAQVFTKGLMKDKFITMKEYNDLIKNYDRLMKENKIKPDLIIYIKTTPSVSYFRLKSRGRPEEHEVKIDTIQKIHNLYEEFIQETTHDVIIIDGDRSALEILDEVNMILMNLKTK